MLDVKVKEKGDNVMIKWQFSKIEIPKSEIIEVISDETYSGQERAAIRIGFPYASTERFVVKTTKEDYILFTSSVSIKEKIE
ncbi:hypothetical protein [Halobacillus salinus]|uniref:Sublancin immunity protein SunI-like PH domain-containing protein n=1 Tax=Halobacillus salinus TaxID=192814 RepID=A0A4Z0H0E8_9BACI|nr:hypothetical protein [Halobacillus salinus]TGB03590.1 hypothetical protein E4663_00870 [Halobacillus salinus]